MKWMAGLILGLFFTATLAFAADDQVGVGGITFSVPKGWKKVEPTSTMRAAQLEADAGKDGKADVVFFYFGVGEGGGKKENIARWMNQFQKETRNNEKVTSVQTKEGEVTFVEVQGTFNQGMPGSALTQKPHYALLGAILEKPEGSIFIKMTGSASAVEKLGKLFREMVTFKNLK